ncbi:MAG: aldehyde ferredoxin oxidoreductase family protein [Thermodesulfobacteriota bacterium]
MDRAGIYGWCGRSLQVDLTGNRVQSVPLDIETAKRFLGGRGLNSWTLYQHVRSDIDEFSPANPLILAAGPLCGTLVPASSKFTFTSKSPLTNIFADSCAGGYFGPELKYAGYDQVLITGRSEKPVFLFIDDDNVQILPADTLWGKDTWTTQKEIRRQFGDDIQIASIGQAGENLIRYAGIIHGLKRAAGKFGLGAVMGSKKLKAIAIRGTKGVKIAHPDLLMEYTLETLKEIKKSALYQTRSIYGTPHLEDVLSPLGVMSTRNFRETSFEEYEKIGGIRLTDQYSKRMRSCMACPVHCTHVYALGDGPYAGSAGEGPEFTLTSMVGDRCGIADLEALFKINQLLNEYGMDCAAFGGLVGWAMDCYERGIIDKNDTDGLELTFGNHEAVIELAHKTAKREGFGNILAEGEKRAPQLVGRESEKFMFHTKGGIIIAEEPRALPGFGLAYLTSTRGSDHLRARYPLETIGGGADVAEKLFGSKDAANPKTHKGKGEGVKWFEDLLAVVDSFGLCKFNFPAMMDIVSTPARLAKGYFAVTGVEVSAEQLLQIGERIYNIEKAFNSRLGLSRRDDNFSVPDKFIKEPLKSGAFKGQTFPLDAMLDEYYATRGWGPDGLQTRQKLMELDLGEVAEELASLNVLSG